jgi:hypothetical protein
MAEYESVEKSHGRIEVRKIKAINITTEFAEYLGWKNIRQIFEIERICEKKGKLSKTKLYGVTSLSAEVASVENLLSYKRQHWAIENKSHHVRDVTFNEDRCRVRNRRKAQILSAVRNVVIALLRNAGFKNINEGREWCAWEKNRAITILLGRTE